MTWYLMIGLVTAAIGVWVLGQDQDRQAEKALAGFGSGARLAVCFLFVLVCILAWPYVWVLIIWKAWLKK